MIVKSAYKRTMHAGKSQSYIGLDNQGNLWMSSSSPFQEKDWKPLDFNMMYQGYYPACHFTAVGTTEKDFVAAGMGKDGLPYVFRSLMGGVWESVNLICGNKLVGYQRASGRIVDILYDEKTKQIFMPCDNGELLTIPDCPKCAMIQKITDEEVAGGYLGEDNKKIILRTATEKEVIVDLIDAVQIRISFDFAQDKLREGGILVDLRKIDIDDVGEWLTTQPTDRFIAFLCEYGVQADSAARYARRKGFHMAYSLGGERLRII